MMFWLVLLVVINASVLPVKGAYKQFNSTILSEHIIHYPNDCVSIEIIGEGDDSVIYMTVNQEIHTTSDIMFKPKLTLNGNPILGPLSNDVNLCTLLWKEIYEPKSVEARYKASQAFNLDGFECPIPKGTVKLMPWMLVNQHTLEANLNCGIYNYELSLEQCRPYSNCTSLMMARVAIHMKSNDCIY